MSGMHRYFAIILMMFCCAAASQNTDPRTAKVVLPEPANTRLPSLILIGDSTVRNGQDDGQGKGAAGQWGWGHPLAGFFDPAKINVVNRAIGGLSSRTYLSAGHWQRTLALVKPGDVVLIQFGHNDSGPVNDTSRARGTIKGAGEEVEEIDNLITKEHEVVHSYGWYLRRYVADVKARGATAIICSPIPRKVWGADGKIVRSADSYAGWAAQVAREEHIGFIDLNETIASQYDAMGRDAVMQLFPQVTPDEHTHTNMAGAALNARAVAAGLRAQGAVPPLPTLFLVGDSTVKSGGASGAIGWGERIAPYFNTDKINIANHAIGGRSSRTFFTEGRWTAVLEQLKPGDIVAIQFGHNDGGRIGDPAAKNRGSVPGTGPETMEDTRLDGGKELVHSFGWYMARYVSDARAKGATVILLSPVPHRDAWEQGRDFAEYAQWDEEVARKGGALYVDLTMIVSDGYRKAGAQTVNGFFSDARTHTNDAGAQFNAARVIEAFNTLPGKPLAPYLK
jgi:lysophospholipase L1-like esterase